MTKEGYNQLYSILETIKELVEYLEKQKALPLSSVEFLFEDLRSGIKAVNVELFGSENVNFYDMDEAKRQNIEQYHLWIEMIEKIIERRFLAETNWDEKFLWLMDYVTFVDKDIILENSKKCLWDLDEGQRVHYNLYYQRLKDMWGTLDTEKGVYDVIENRVRELIEHKEDFFWLYNKLGDYRSKVVLCSILYNWITFDLKYIAGMKEGNFADYFDLDLVKCSADEVFVDLGAYTGDSVLGYINTYGVYKRIYCYEITEKTMGVMQENLSGYADIEYRNKGAGAKSGKMYMQEMEKDCSCNRINNEVITGKEIEVVTIDDDIKEKVTMIKMDIEGAEQDALIGCRRHIVEEHPKLLISVYHNNEDVWKIPRMIEDMNGDYKFYLRSNGEQWGPAEIVLLAL